MENGSKQKFQAITRCVKDVRVILYTPGAPQWLLKTKSQFDLLASATAKMQKQMLEGSPRFTGELPGCASDQLCVDYQMSPTGSILASWFRHTGQFKGSGQIVKPVATAIISPGHNPTETTSIAIDEQRLSQFGVGFLAGDIRYRIENTNAICGVLVNLEANGSHEIDVQISFASMVLALRSHHRQLAALNPAPGRWARLN